MGERFHHLSAGARSVFEEASDVVGRDVAALCFRAPPDELRDTRNAQIAVVVTGLAAYELASEWGFRPEVLAGHSVGELAAVVAAGCLDLTTGIRAVRERAELMGAVPTPGTMAAVGGVDPALLAQLCSSVRDTGQVAVAVYNSDANTVIAGDVHAVEAVVAAVKAEGGMARPLDVSHAFHSPLMEPMAAAWSDHVQTLPLRDPKVPIVGNVTAAPLRTASDVREELTAQVLSPVRWAQSLACLGALGVRAAVELGDTRVLAGFSRSATPPLKTISLGHPQGIRSLARLVEEGGR